MVRFLSQGSMSTGTQASRAALAPQLAVSTVMGTIDCYPDSSLSLRFGGVPGVLVCSRWRLLS